jgi:hypothetical protein
LEENNIKLSEEASRQRGLRVKVEKELQASLLQASKITANAS